MGMLKRVQHDVIFCMNQGMLDHYLQFSQFTDPGLYKEKLIKDLPDDIRRIGLLIRRNVVHRTTLRDGNTGTNTDLKYGDMTKIPWWRQPEDDNFPTAVAMIAELYRRDPRGFVNNRAEEDKLVVTCRFVSLIMASILKAKDIASRVRSGFAPYFTFLGDLSFDHWINQYWDKEKNRWITIDVDGSLEVEFDAYDIKESLFDWPAQTWLKVRKGKVDGKHFYNAGGFDGLMPIGWALIYDYHSLMNDEIIYMHSTVPLQIQNFPKLKEADLQEIDHLAVLMQQPDKNFDELKKLWETNKKFRLLKGALL